MAKLFILLQYLLPHHLLSRLTAILANSTLLKNLLIRAFIKRYKVDLSDALVESAENYVCFNAFFTRHLKPQARPLPDAANAIVSPADGVISQIGRLDGERILQAKGQDYRVQELLGGDAEMAAQFVDGSFATVYLSPRDYHRVHMPLSGQLEKMIYVPGRLFSVNQTTAAAVPRLFARNERAVCLFSTDAGPMAVVLVGAMIVAGIETVWAGQVCPGSAARQIRVHEYQQQPAVKLATGAELGHFKLGSTVIVLFGHGAVEMDAALVETSALRMGQTLGTVISTDISTNSSTNTTTNTSTSTSTNTSTNIPTNKPTTTSTNISGSSDDTR